jgi:signal peptidase I
MVFRYPVDTRMDYIKRVVGMPGDEVTYTNQKLSINGQPVPVQAQGDFYDDDSLRYAPKFTEKLGEVAPRHPGRPEAQRRLPADGRASRWP